MNAPRSPDADRKRSAPASSDVQGELDFAEETVRQARKLSEALFREAKNTPEYHRALGTKERMDEFTSSLIERARRINRRWQPPLSDDVVREVAQRMAARVTTWKHHPDLQRERQGKQAAARRRKNRSRDLQILYLADCGESQRDIARRLGISRGAVDHVLRRDAELRAAPRARAAAEKHGKVVRFRKPEEP